MLSDMKRCAVVTDAAASGYFLPVWSEYYGGAFGYDNLFVVCYEDEASTTPGRASGSCCTSITPTTIIFALNCLTIL